jgi:uncharacterized membrane protein YdbT with pleckstrin-like domain
MSNYVERTLLPGEQIVASARPHWAMFVGPGLVVGFGLLVSKAGGIFIVAGIVWAIFRYLVFNGTELAVTNKRVVAKSGIVRRNVVDVALTKVEGITYHQGIMGRMFGYGSILVRGTGVGQVPIPFIAEPELFKHEVGQLLYAS